MTLKEEIFGVASFRSRQQVLQMEAALRREGVPVSIVTTPREVALGCGLSVRFELADAADVRDVYLRTRPGNLIGFYRVERGADGRTSIAALGTLSR